MNFATLSIYFLQDCRKGNINLYIPTLVNANLAVFFISAKMWLFQEFNNDIIPATGKPGVTVSHI